MKQIRFMKNVSWNQISEYRNELFGLSIISIMVFHYFEGVAGADYISRPMKVIALAFNGAIGSVGVDIFLFLSGFGIWYALKKRPQVIDFYIKRIRRVLIPYLVMGGVFWIVKDFIITPASVSKFLYDLTLLSFWGSGVRTFWYISLICILYLLSPVLFEKGRKAYIYIGVASVIITIYLYFLNRTIFTHVEIATLRIPVYLFGMYCADLADQKIEISRKVCVLLALSVPAKVIVGVLDFPFSRLFNAVYAVFLVCIYLLVRQKFNGGKVSRFLVATGAVSLELYIVHVAIRNIMGTIGLGTASPAIYGLCILISIPIAILFSKLQGVLLKTSN